jgi:hypothetical protein
MIEVILTCIDCSAKSEPVVASSIDTYTYHDAPSDGVVFDEPDHWWLYVDRDIVLCPAHSDADNRQRHLDNAREIERAHQEHRKPRLR